jgi:hypothetical protein
MKPPITRPTMKPKIQLEAEADGSATSRGSSSEIGPSTMISGVPAGSLVGTSTLSMAVGAGVVRLVLLVPVNGLRLLGGCVGAAVGAGDEVGLAVGGGVLGPGLPGAGVPRHSGQGLQ